jgi:thioredoxin 1
MKYIQHKSFKIATIAILAVIVISFITVNLSRSSNIASEEVQKSNGKVIILTDKTFEQTIKKGITLVDFWAVWCGPCKKQGPIIDKIAEEYGSKAKICKIDIDQNPVISTKYNVTLIPTILIFKNGKVVQKYVGLQQKDVLVNKIKELL